MFAQVMTFEETPDQLEAGIEHVLEEVIPPLRSVEGLQGCWLVDRERGQRITVMVWADEAAAQAGMQKIQAERAKNPDRQRPTPTSIERYDVYGIVAADTLGTEQSTTTV